jgi:hypothetical protein
MMMPVSIFRVSNSRAHVGCIAEDMSYISSSCLLFNTICGSLLVVDLMGSVMFPRAQRNQIAALAVGTGVSLRPVGQRRLDR